MFERVSRQVELSPYCDWGTPSSVYALHARNGAMFGPVEIGDSSTHQGALPCGASRFGLVNDGACAFADGWTARSTTSRERRRFRAVPPCRMPRPRPHEQGASAAVSREAGDPRIGDGATALWSDAGRSPPRWRCGARFDSAPPALDEHFCFDMDDNFVPVR